MSNLSSSSAVSSAVELPKCFKGSEDKEPLFFRHACLQPLGPNANMIFHALHDLCSRVLPFCKINK